MERSHIISFHVIFLSHMLHSCVEMFPEHSITDCGLWENWTLEMYIRRAETPSAPGQSYTSIVVTGKSQSQSLQSQLYLLSVSQLVIIFCVTLVLGHVLFSLVEVVHKSKHWSLLSVGNSLVTSLQIWYRRFHIRRISHTTLVHQQVHLFESGDINRSIPGQNTSNSRRSSTRYWTSQPVIAVC